MKQRTICKTFAVAVILLFVGLGIQPTVAVTQETTDSYGKYNKNDTSIGLGFILCIVYGVWDPGFPMGLIFEPLVPVVCEDLDTGNSRFGITRLLGFHIFKFLPIGHNYNIKIKTRQNWREQTVSNLNFINIVNFRID